MALGLEFLVAEIANAKSALIIIVTGNCKQPKACYWPISIWIFFNLQPILVRLILYTNISA